MTPRDLIASSLRLINVIGAGEAMSASEASDGLTVLNQMLDSWSSDGAVIYSKSTDTKALTAGVQSYTMGPSGDINTTRPVKITAAVIQEGNDRYELGLNSWDAYSQVGDDTTQDIPRALYINNGYPLVTLKLSPVPKAGLSLTVYSDKELSDMTLDTVLSLPPGFERAIRYNLAIDLAPEYEKEPSPTIQRVASQSLATIKRSNRNYPSRTMTTDPVLNASSNFNIYRGY